MVVNVASNHLSELRELIGSVAHKCLLKVWKSCGLGSLGGSF